MFTWFQKKDWRHSAAHSLLLNEFRRGESPDRYRYSDAWKSVLGEEPSDVIARFLNEQLLEPAELKELVAHKFKVPDLKFLLKERGLRASGRKDQLIQRLIEHDTQSLRDATKGLVLYRCTEEGTRLANCFLEAQKEARCHTESAVLDHLKRGRLSEAVRIVARYEASQVFPRGVGIDWKNYDVESTVDSLSVILEATPGILRRMEGNRLRELRPAAAMMDLWGTNTVRSWVSDDFETGIHLDSDAASRMLVFHAWHVRNMRSYALTRARTVEVRPVNDGIRCAECGELNGRRYKLEEVPELPYAKCTCELGCRCTTVVVDRYR